MRAFGGKKEFRVEFGSIGHTEGSFVQQTNWSGIA